MNWLLMMGLFAVLPIQTLNAGENSGAGPKTYRSEKFGYELSYPPEIELTSYFDGSGGDLKDARTGGLLAHFDVWPPDECLREPEDLTAKEIGIRRAQDITQADGDGTSSHCGDPLTARDVASLHGVKIYELELTCVSEIFPGSDDDEIDTKNDTAVIDAEPIVTVEGKKGPMYFVDISQPWLKRIMIVDPAGNGPHLEESKGRIDMPIIRTILANIKTFAVPKPPGMCIQDLPRGSTFTTAAPRP